MRLRTKLTALIISAGLCFSLVADAKTVKIPQWIFGFTFGAPVAVHRAQCKALKGTWNYNFDNCENPRLVGLGPECNVKGLGKMIAGGSNNEYGTTSSKFSFYYGFTYPREPAACANKWLEWAHATFGEPSCKDENQFWWERRGSPYDYISIRVNGPGSGNSVFVFFLRQSNNYSACDDLE